MVVRFKDPTTIVTGKQYLDISPNIRNGKVQTYRNTSTSFALVQTFNGSHLDYLGANIEISGNLMLVGKGSADPRLYLYNTTTNLWYTSFNSIAPTISNGVYFGATLAIQGDKVLVLDTYYKFGEFYKITTTATSTTDVSYQSIGLPNFCYHLYQNARISAINNGLYLIGEAAEFCSRPGRVIFGEYNNSF